MKTKVSRADAFVKQENAELKKEVTRLQKLLAKNEVNHFSEIAALKAQLSEEKKNTVKVSVISYADTLKK